MVYTCLVRLYTYLYVILLILIRIEHLEAPVLSLLPDSLFGTLNPKVIIVTTPNADFNVLFPNLTGYRHWDHKFEWTRIEFKSWYKSLTYHYINACISCIYGSTCM